MDTRSRSKSGCLDMFVLATTKDANCRFRRTCGHLLWVGMMCCCQTAQAACDVSSFDLGRHTQGDFRIHDFVDARTGHNREGARRHRLSIGHCPLRFFRLRVTGDVIATSARHERLQMVPYLHSIGGMPLPRLMDMRVNTTPHLKATDEVELVFGIDRQAALDLPAGVYSITMKFAFEE